MPAPVVRVPLTLDQPALFERVQDSDQLAAVQPERIGDRGLGFPGLFAEEGEDAVVVETEAGLLDFCDRLRFEGVAETCE